MAADERTFPVTGGEAKDTPVVAERAVETAIPATIEVAGVKVYVEGEKAEADEREVSAIESFLQSYLPPSFIKNKKEELTKRLTELYRNTRGLHYTVDVASFLEKIPHEKVKTVFARGLQNGGQILPLSIAITKLLRISISYPLSEETREKIVKFIDLHSDENFLSKTFFVNLPRKQFDRIFYIKYEQNDNWAYSNLFTHVLDIRQRYTLFNKIK
ncbi:MAG: hypothetical protein QXS16_03710, partial [Pyrobaculum sp.]